MSITYFGNLAFVALVIALRFLVDFCMYVLNVIKVNNLGSF
jgi:hypothetical protein